MRASSSTRIWFALVAAMLWAGIYLTGFATVNWLLYVPAAVFIFAAATGFCPSQIAVFKLFGSK